MLVISLGEDGVALHVDLLQAGDALLQCGLHLEGLSVGGGGSGGELERLHIQNLICSSPIVIVHNRLGVWWWKNLCSC